MFPWEVYKQIIQMSLASEQIVIHWFLSKGQKLPLNVYILTGPHVPPADVTVVWPMPDPLLLAYNSINQACSQTFGNKPGKVTQRNQTLRFQHERRPRVEGKWTLCCEKQRRVCECSQVWNFLLNWKTNQDATIAIPDLHDPNSHTSHCTRT